MLRATALSSSSPAIAAAYDAAYDTDLDRSNASCPCDLGHMHSVHFGRVEILEFRRAIGDNPSCASGGPPLQLGGLQSSQSIDLDDYEIHRTMNRRKREQMMVPPHMREVRNIIMNGYPIDVYYNFTLFYFTHSQFSQILSLLHYRYGFGMLDMAPLRSTRVSAKHRSSNDKDKRASKRAPWSTNYPNDSRTSRDF